MRWMVRVLGLGVVAAVAATLGLGCGGVRIEVGAAPAGRPSCASVCQQMASCPGKGPACLQGCESAQSIVAQAACEGSLQVELDCLSAQANVCEATRTACRTQTMTLGACITNYCTHQRIGSPNQGLCLQAAVAF